MAVVAVVTFVIAYILIATERVPKMVTALAGAGVILAFGIASSEDAFYSHDTGVDWDVIFLLLGMMIIVGILRQTGVFEYIAIWAAKRAKGSPFRVMVLLVLITAFASALLDNVTTVLLIAPVTLLVCERLGVPSSLPDRRSPGIQHWRRRYLDRRPAQHHHREPIRADLQ
jgi:Na+/H+ antiporter NhaD/arsenite permease-like protein